MICIVFAHPPEVKELKDLIEQLGSKSEIVWLRWRSETDRPLIAPHMKFDLILNVGFAGRLNENLALGEVVLVNAIKSPSINDLPGQLQNIESVSRFADNHKIRTASLATASDPVTTLKAKQLLRSGGADIVDMEAAHLLRLANESGLPFAAFKVVSDNADAGSWDTIKKHKHEWATNLAAVVYEFIQAN